jgi:hypothetical protein
MRLIRPRLISLISLDYPRCFEHTDHMMKARGIPVLVDRLGYQTPLQRIYLGSGNHKEKWLQELIHAHPSILPVSEIEPGFGSLIPTALEVSCAHGRLDNLFLTPSGDIVFVETKLWRNTEMRREVVAQVLEVLSEQMYLLCAERGSR